MHSQRVHRCDDRIVNIYQPWVRPMVTGKQSKKTEFGPKSSVSLIGGFACVHALRWNNFHEAHDLKGQVIAYTKRYGHYPESVIADQKYGTRDNRKWLKERNIRFSGKALGRPKLYLSPEDLELKKRSIEEQRLRTHIEGKFGQGKNGYNLARIRARLMKTSASWIAAIYFVMNLKKFSEFLYHIFRYCLALWPRWEQIKPDSRYESFPTALGQADNLLVLMHPIVPLSYPTTKMRLGN